MPKKEETFRINMSNPLIAEMKMKLELILSNDTQPLEAELRHSDNSICSSRRAECNSQTVFTAIIFFGPHQIRMFPQMRKGRLKGSG